MKKLLLCSLLILGACSVKDEPTSEAPTPEAPTPEAPTPEAPTPGEPTPEEEELIKKAFDDAKTQIPSEALKNITIYSWKEKSSTDTGTLLNTEHAIINDTHFSIIHTKLREEITFNSVEITALYQMGMTSINGYIEQPGDKYYKLITLKSKIWKPLSIDPENGNKWVDSALNPIGTINYYIIRQTDSELTIMPTVYDSGGELSLSRNTNVYKRI